MGLNNVWFKICCSVGLKGAVQRFGLEAVQGSVLLSAEGWLFILSLRFEALKGGVLVAPLDSRYIKFDSILSLFKCAKVSPIVKLVCIFGS